MGRAKKKRINANRRKAARLRARVVFDVLSSSFFQGAIQRYAHERAQGIVSGGGPLAAWLRGVSSEHQAKLGAALGAVLGEPSPEEKAAELRRRISCSFDRAMRHGATRPGRGFSRSVLATRDDEPIR